METPQTSWRAAPQGGLFAVILFCLMVLLMVLPEGLDYSRLAAAAVVGARPDAATATGGNLVTPMLWLLLCFGSCWLLAARHALARQLLVQVNPWLVGILALAGLSLGWSIDPALSLRRLFRMVVIVLCIGSLVLSGWTHGRLLTVLRRLLTSLLAASLVFGVLQPAYAIHRELSPELLGAWRGLASHKNAFGGLSALACLLWLQAASGRKRQAAPAIAGAAIAVLCLWLSRSSTAVLAAGVGGMFVLSFARARGASRRKLGVATTVLVSSAVLAGLGSVKLLPGWSLLSAPVALAAGKDTSLTGRTVIWEVVRDHIALRPLLGSGYGAYWQPDRRIASESAAILSRLGGFYPGTAHNGYLDLTNDLGFGGLLLLLGFILRHARDAVQLAGTDWSGALPWLAVLLQQCVTNLSESHWFNVTSVDFVFMSAASLELSRQRLQGEFERIHGPAPRDTR